VKKEWIAQIYGHGELIVPGEIVSALGPVTLDLWLRMRWGGAAKRTPDDVQIELTPRMVAGVTPKGGRRLTLGRVFRFLGWSEQDIADLSTRDRAVAITCENWDEVSSWRSAGLACRGS